MRRWQPWANSLAGLPADRWWRLLKENQFAVDPAFYHRAAFHTLSSLGITLYAQREEHLYGAAIEKTRLVGAPIFIVGHHRSGTTHLHNLLGLDQAQFAYPNTYQVGFPFCFLSSEDVLARMLAPLLPRRRPMDNVAVDFEQPQEDEFALSLISFCSPYLWFVFPNHYERYAPYLTFNDVSSTVIDRWQTALIWFTKKLSYKYQRRLVFKSPFHTARIRLILDVFPDACFIHIYRNPYAVFQSFRRMTETLPWLMCLQNPGAAFTDDRLIEMYTVVYDNFFRDQAAIPNDQFHQVQFETLEQDPIGEIRLIYEKFGFHGFEAVEPELRRYLNRIAGYRKNTFPEISAPLKKRLARAWQRSFESWGYPVEGGR
jgi:omega-hydroxy-beta-dihydromenaquinone-9 sulfotransferase